MTSLSSIVRDPVEQQPSEPASSFSDPSRPFWIVHNVIVKRVNIQDAKTNLSRYLADLAPGEVLVLCNRNQPVAEVRSLRTKAVRRPRIGAAAGKFAVPDSFFDPLPNESIKAFTGK